MYRIGKTGTTIFWILLGITLLSWILRGIGLLTFVPGGFIWILIISTMGAGIFSAIQQTKRW